MKTLVVSEVFPPRTGGSGRWLYELYRRFPQDSVQVVAGQCEGDEAFDRQQPLPIDRAALTFQSWGLVGFHNVRQYTTAYRRVASMVKRGRIAQVHCGRILPEGLIAWMVHMRHRVPYACYVHGEELNTAGTSRELSFLARRVLKGARVLIANSLNTARVLMHQWDVPASQIEVLHPGVDASYFVPAARDEAARASLGWKERRVILTVGRLQARKGHAKLIEALSAVIERFPDALYAIVGEGETRGSIESLVRDRNLSNHVQLLGELRDEQLLTAMQQCDLFALPNIEVNGDFEGFGMVLVEAQACGKPVIAGKSGGTAETMRDGETGRLVDCTSPSELSSAIIEQLELCPATSARGLSSIGDAGRRWVERHFDWPALTRQAQTIFAERFGNTVERRKAA